MAESLINIEVRGQTIEKKDYRSSSGIWTFGRNIIFCVCTDSGAEQCEAFHSFFCCGGRSH